EQHRHAPTRRRSTNNVNAYVPGTHNHVSVFPSPLGRSLSGPAGHSAAGGRGGHPRGQDSSALPAGELFRRKVRRTIRGELTNRPLIVNQRHLRVALAEYVRHYNGRRRPVTLAPRDRAIPWQISTTNGSRVARFWVV